MKAFHGDPKIKAKYLTRLTAHYNADEIVQGQYWENGKGGAVGCTVHSEKHSDYESELGIPSILAHFQDRIFERLPNELAKEFPIEFLSAINVGADLTKVGKLFIIWILTDHEYGVLQFAKDKKVVQDVADAYKQEMISPVPVEKWRQLTKDAFDSGSHAAAVAALYVYTALSNPVYGIAVIAYTGPCTAPKQWYTAAAKKLIELLTETY